MITQTVDDESQQQIVFALDPEPDIRRCIRQFSDSLGIPSRTYSTAAEFFRGYQEQPGCLVTAVRLPDLGGLHVIRRLRETQAYCPPSVVISDHADVASAVEAMKLGALDFLVKPFSPQLLLDQIQHALQLDHTLRARHRKCSRFHRAMGLLTPREAQVLRDLMTGRSNKETAAHLHISQKTISTHRAHLLEKLGASNLVELVRLMVQCAQGAAPSGSECSDMLSALSDGPTTSFFRSPLRKDWL